MTTRFPACQRQFVGLIAFAAVLSVNHHLFAQTENPPPPTAPVSDVAVAPSSPTPAEPAAVSPTIEERLKALEQKDAGKATRIEELESTVAALNEQLAAADNDGSEDRKLSAWGFFDLTLGKSFYDNSRALYASGTPRYASFMSNGINVYVKSEMTKTLSAMVETRLTYTPVGLDTDIPRMVYVDGKYLQTDGTFAREQTLYRTPYSYFSYHQHGVFIERAHVDWKPKDWFGIRLGRYLTPFGIWNEDHGSPVVLGVDMPNLINFALVPIHQMGLQIYGNRLLTDNLNLEYAVTLSNGRGPIDEYKDLDNDKAIGLRGKLVYTSDDLFMRLGGYAYTGRYTDRREEYYIYLTPNFGLDRSQPVPLSSASPTTESYRETIGTLDALVQFKGLKVMAELAHRRVIYSTAPLMNAQGALLNNVPYGTHIHAANYTGIAYYALAGYEVDLGESLGNVKVTPYVGADHLSPDQTMPFLDMNQYRFGINIKPSPYITNKLEAMRLVPKAPEMASKMWLLVAQTAVSF